MSISEDEAGAQLAEMVDQAAAERLAPTIHSDGIYFGLDMATYRRDPACGSSDMEKLALRPCDYWWGSWMNAMKPPDKSTSHQEVGTAVHLIVLEGESAFDARYARTVENDPSMPAGQKAAATRKANEEIKKSGQIPLPPLDYDRCLMAGAMIKRNPKLKTAFEGGASEVSVFWTLVDETNPSTGEVTKLARPMRKKARIDYLKPRGVGDLKKVMNEREYPFPQACLTAITNYKYHVQAAHYLDARARMPAMIKAAQVFYEPGSGAPAYVALLDGILKSKRFGWQWVFWQGQGAPLTYSRNLSPGNPIIEMARGYLERAERNFQDYFARYGETMWIDEAEPTELMIEEMPFRFGND